MQRQMHNTNEWLCNSFSLSLYTFHHYILANRIRTLISYFLRNFLFIYFFISGSLCLPFAVCVSLDFTISRYVCIIWTSTRRLSFFVACKDSISVWCRWHCIFSFVAAQLICGRKYVRNIIRNWQKWIQQPQQHQQQYICSWARLLIATCKDAFYCDATPVHHYHTIMYACCVTVRYVNGLMSAIQCNGLMLEIEDSREV